MLRNILLVFLGALALSACDSHVAKPEMQKADEAAAQAGAAAKDAAIHAVDAAKHAGTALKEEVKEATRDTKISVQTDKQP